MYASVPLSNRMSETWVHGIFLFTRHSNAMLTANQTTKSVKRTTKDAKHTTYSSTWKTRVRCRIHKDCATNEKLETVTSTKLRSHMKSCVKKCMTHPPNRVVQSSARLLSQRLRVSQERLWEMRRPSAVSTSIRNYVKRDVYTSPPLQNDSKQLLVY